MKFKTTYLKHYTLLVFGMFCIAIMSSQSEKTDILIGNSGNDGARVMIQSVDGNYILAGWHDMQGIHSHSKGLIASVSPDGNLNWKKVLTTNERNQVSALVQQPNGNLLAIIEEFYTEDEPGQVILTQLSRSGEILQKTPIGGTGSDVIDKIKVTTDGGYILAGESSLKSDNKDAWVIKLSPSFEKEWEWRKGTAGRDRLTDVIVLPNNDIVVSGNTTAPGADNSHKHQIPLLVKLNAQGEEIWSCDFKSSHAASIRGITATNSGGIIFSGFTRQNKTFNAWIGNVSSEGALSWNTSLSLPKASYLHNVTSKKDNIFTAVGVCFDTETQNDALIVNFSENGSNIKGYNYPKIGQQEARAILYNEDALILTGTSGPSRKEKQLWFLKIPKIEESWLNYKFLKNEE